MVLPFKDWIAYISWHIMLTGCMFLDHCVVHLKCRRYIYLFHEVPSFLLWAAAPFLPWNIVVKNAYIYIYIYDKNGYWRGKTWEYFDNPICNDIYAKITIGNKIHLHYNKRTDQLSFNVINLKLVYQTKGTWYIHLIKHCKETPFHAPNSRLCKVLMKINQMTMLDVFFDLNKRNVLTKQSNFPWFETPQHSCGVTVMRWTVYWYGMEV